MVENGQLSTQVTNVEEITERETTPGHLHGHNHRRHAPPGDGNSNAENMMETGHLHISECLTSRFFSIKEETVSLQERNVATALCQG